jgi:hypothetical protein
VDIFLVVESLENEEASEQDEEEVSFFFLNMANFVNRNTGTDLF